MRHYLKLIRIRWEDIEEIIIQRNTKDSLLLYNKFLSQYKDAFINFFTMHLIVKSKY